MEPKIAREYYLIALNPKNGSYFSLGSDFGYGVLGGILMDLYQCNRIRFQNKKIILIDNSPTNYAIFDKAIELIGKRGPVRVSTLIARMAFKGRFYKNELIELLLSNKDILRVKKKFMIFSYNRYFPADREFRLSIVRRVRDILLRNETPLPNELLLLSLIYACQIYRALSDDRAERKHMRQSLKNIIKKGNNYSPDFENVKELSTGIRNAITAARATHTAVS